MSRQKEKPDRKQELEEIGEKAMREVLNDFNKAIQRPDFKHGEVVELIGDIGQELREITEENDKNFELYLLTLLEDHQIEKLVRRILKEAHNVHMKGINKLSEVETRILSKLYKELSHINVFLKDGDRKIIIKFIGEIWKLLAEECGEEHIGHLYEYLKKIAEESVNEFANRLEEHDHSPIIKRKS